MNKKVKVLSEWNLWIEGDLTKMGYFTGRDQIEATIGSSGGSGSGFGGWDVSYHNLKDEATARKMGEAVGKLNFVKSVHIYSNADAGNVDKHIYLKGKPSKAEKKAAKKIVSKK